MGKICDAATMFETECAKGLVSGYASARQTKLLYPSRKTSDLDETYFSKRLLVLFADLRLNGVSVIFPTEGYTGADIEIHVLLNYGGWCGLRLQAKRAVLENGRLVIKELAHPNGTGTQNATLFQSSIDDKMSPLYLYYIPGDLVVDLQQGGSSASGAMVGSAWDAREFIDTNTLSAKTIVTKNTATLSSILCTLDSGAAFSDHHFVSAVESLFLDHLEDPFQGELDGDLDELFPELYEVEEPFLEQAQTFKVARSVPAKIEKYFREGVWPRLQQKREHAGAVLINRKMFVND